MFQKILYCPYDEIRCVSLANVDKNLFLVTTSTSGEILINGVSDLDFTYGANNSIIFLINI